MSGLVLATLDAESRWARELYGAGGREPPGRVLRGLGAMGTLLRAFCGEGDALWLVHPTDPARMPDVPGLPRPALLAGPLPIHGAYDAVLPWAEVAGATRRPTLGREGVWSAPPLGGLQGVVNHRKVGLEIAREIGLALPGARWVDGSEALDEALVALVAERGLHAPWVLKPAYSAAGRDQVRGEGASLAPALAEAAGLAIGCGGALLEPWMDRTADYGWRGWASDAGPESRGGHRLLVDAAGRFKGIELGGPDLPAELEPAALAIGERLVERGYRGPYTVDGFAYRMNGAVAIHACCEVNARFTFGWVAAALRDRLAGPLGIAASDSFALELGRATAGEFADTDRCIHLLRPAPDDPWAAWIRW